MTLLLDFANSHLPLKKYPFPAKIVTGVDLGFGREWWWWRGCGCGVWSGGWWWSRCINQSFHCKQPRHIDRSQVSACSDYLRPSSDIIPFSVPTPPPPSFFGDGIGDLRGNARSFPHMCTSLPHSMCVNVSRFAYMCMYDFFTLTPKEATKLRTTVPSWGGIHWWPMDSPHKGPVTREAFPCHYIILVIDL